MKIEETKLKNGATIIGINDPSAKTVAIFFGFRVGSTSEDPKIMGISHFIEHMVFKGSEKYPTAKILAEKVDEIGAAWNAFTDKEMTAYHIWTAKENFDLALDVIGDMVTKPLFDEEEIKKESGTIIQELNMYEDSPVMNMQEDEIFKVTYGDSPLGRDIIGTIETINATTGADIKEYCKKYYVGSNAVIVIAGNLPGNYLEKATEYAERFKTGEKNSPERSIFSKNNLTLKNKKTDQSHIGICLPTFDAINSKTAATKIIGTILGGYLSSRLFTEIREKRGWAYYIQADLISLSESGFLVFLGGIKNDKVLEATELIKKEVLSFAETVTEDELKRAKGNISGMSKLRYENISRVAESIGKQFLTKGSYEMPEEALAKIEKVSLSDVRSVAKEIFTKDKIKLAVIGPFSDEEKFAKILSQ